MRTTRVGSATVRPSSDHTIERAEHAEALAAQASGTSIWQRPSSLQRAISLSSMSGLSFCCPSTSDRPSSGISSSSTNRRTMSCSSRSSAGRSNISSTPPRLRHVSSPVRCANKIADFEHASDGSVLGQARAIGEADHEPDHVRDFAAVKPAVRACLPPPCATPEESDRSSGVWSSGSPVSRRASRRSRGLHCCAAGRRSSASPVRSADR